MALINTTPVAARAKQASEAVAEYTSAPHFRERPIRRFASGITEIGTDHPGDEDLRRWDFPVRDHGGWHQHTAQPFFWYAPSYREGLGQRWRVRIHSEHRCEQGSACPVSTDRTVVICSSSVAVGGSMRVLAGLRSSLGIETAQVYVDHQLSYVAPTLSGLRG